MIRNTVMSRGWTAAVVAAILATVAALAFLGIARAQSASDLTVGSATVEPGAEVTIEVTATLENVGSFGVNIEFDGTLVTVKAECGANFGSCNAEFGINTVRLNGAQGGSGISGDNVVLGSFTFVAGSTEGVANLTIVSTEVSDEVGDALSFSSTNNGAITIATATAAPTDEPTATPGAVPATGGAPGTSSVNSMAWLLAAAGLTIVAGGAWVLARAGREN